MRFSQLLLAAAKSSSPKPKQLPKNNHNLPDRFIRKQTAFVSIYPPKMPQYNQEEVKRWIDPEKGEQPYYDEHRPWQDEFQRQNGPMVKQPKIFVQPFRKFPVLLGDVVQVMVGKDKGKQGIVNYIVQERNWLFVEGLHLERRIVNRDHNNPGTIMSKELPLLYPSQVQLVDPTDKTPIPIVEWRFDEDGNEVRVSPRTDQIVPIPEIEAFSTVDYKTIESYIDQPKDTLKSDVEKVTFMPTLATFEMDLMEQYGIEEDRIPYQFFWY